MMDLVKELEESGDGVMVEESYCGMLMFADDMAMMAETEEGMGRMLDKVDEFSKKWRFKFNEKKSKVMVIARRQRREKRRWWLGSKEVEETEEYKYLGVWMDAKLKGKTHMEKRIERAEEAKQRVGWMGRVNGVMETERGAVIWETMGLPTVNFATEVSWKGTKSQQKKMDAVQEQVGRKILGANRSVASCAVMGELGWRTMTERNEDQMMRYLGRLRRMDETRLTKKLYEVSLVEDLPWWKEMKAVLRKYANKEEVDESTCIPDGKTRKEKCEQRWAEEVQNKKTLDLYAAVKNGLKKESYVDDPGDRRGARLKFRFRSRSAGLRAEVGGWKNREESRQCVMCSEGEDESVEHVMMRCAAYRREREQLWEGIRSESGLGEGWGWLEEEEKVEVLLGRDMDMEGGERIDSKVKNYLRRVVQHGTQCIDGSLTDRQ